MEVVKQHQTVFEDGYGAGGCTEIAKATYSRLKALEDKGQLGGLHPAIWTVQKPLPGPNGGIQEDHHFVVLEKAPGSIGAILDHRLFNMPDIWSAAELQDFTGTMWWDWKSIGPIKTPETFDHEQYRGPAPYAPKDYSPRFQPSPAIKPPASYRGEHT